MNYESGRKLTFTSFILFFVIVTLQFVVSRLGTEGFLFTKYLVIYNVSFIVHTVLVAIGFLVMYLDGKDKSDFSITLSLGIKLLAIIFLYSAGSNYILTLNRTFCVIAYVLCALFPLAWALKLRRELPLISIALVIIAIWTVASYFVISELTVALQYSPKIALYSSLYNIFIYAEPIVFIIAAYCDT